MSGSTSRLGWLSLQDHTGNRRSYDCGQGHHAGSRGGGTSQWAGTAESGRLLSLLQHLIFFYCLVGKTWSACTSDVNVQTGTPFVIENQVALLFWFLLSGNSACKGTLKQHCGDCSMTQSFSNGTLNIVDPKSTRRWAGKWSPGRFGTVSEQRLPLELSNWNFGSWFSPFLSFLEQIFDQQATPFVSDQNLENAVFWVVSQLLTQQ